MEDDVLAYTTAADTGAGAGAVDNARAVADMMANETEVRLIFPLKRVGLTPHLGRKGRQRAPFTLYNARQIQWIRVFSTHRS